MLQVKADHCTLSASKRREFKLLGRRLVLPPGKWKYTKIHSVSVQWCTGVCSLNHIGQQQPYSEWVSEQFLNGTSAQLGYTVPFMSVYSGKYRTEDKLKTDTRKTKHNPEKHSKTKLAWFSRLLQHSATKQGGLILQRSQAHTGQITHRTIWTVN